MGASSARGWRAVPSVLVALAALVIPAQAVVAAPEGTRPPTVKPARARPGDVVLVTIPRAAATAAEDGPAEVSVELPGKTARGWPTRRGYQSLVPLPTDTAEGGLTLTVKLGGEPVEPAPTVLLRPRVPKEVKLTVDQRFVDPPPEARQQIEADGVAVNRAYSSSAGGLAVRKPFRWPRPQVSITSRFGERRLFNGTLESEHEGTDLRAREGDPVRAANEGVVVLSRDCFHSGKTVIIAHGGRVFTAYFHLSELQVKEGQDIRQGEEIGLVGSTGRSTAPHVHFAVHVAGQYVDPESFMRLRLEQPVPEPPARSARAPGK